MMKLSLVLSVLIAAATAGTAVANKDLEVIEEPTTFAFKAKSNNANPIQSPEKDGFVQACLQSSYNAIHDPAEYELESLEIDHETVDVKKNPHYKDSSSLTGAADDDFEFHDYYVNSWTYWSTGWYGKCTFCNPNGMLSSAQSADMYATWEETFCSCLSAGPFEDFQTAEKCVIKRDVPTTKKVAREHKKSAQVKQPVVANKDLEVIEEPTTFTFKAKSNNANPIQSPEKDGFVQACLQSSYNAIHDPAEYELESLEIDHETVDVKKNPHYKDSSSLTGAADDDFEFHDYYVNSWTYWSTGWYGKCTFCNPNGMLSSAQSADMYATWEETFCSCLSAGPFEDFQTAEKCVIKRDVPTTKKVAREHKKSAQVKQPVVANKDLEVIEEPTTFTFKAKSNNANPIQSPEKDGFVQACLQSSYNAIHDPAEYELESLEIDHETVDVKKNPHYKDSSSLTGAADDDFEFHDYYVNSWTYWSTGWYGKCTFCNPNGMLSSAQSADMYATWEETFCSCLSAGPFEDFQTAEKCVIKRDVPTTKKVTYKKTKTKTIPLLRGASQNEKL